MKSKHEVLYFSHQKYLSLRHLGSIKHPPPVADDIAMEQLLHTSSQSWNQNSIDISLLPHSENPKSACNPHNFGKICFSIPCSQNSSQRVSTLPNPSSGYTQFLLLIEFVRDFPLHIEDFSGIWESFEYPPIVGFHISEESR